MINNPMENAPKENKPETAPAFGKARFSVLLTAVCIAVALLIAALCVSIVALVKYTDNRVVVEHHYDNDLYQGVVDKYKYNAVELRLGSSYGTAFVYTFDGAEMYLITNFHVSGAEPAFLSARFYGKNSYNPEGNIEILGYNEAYDVSVLRTRLYPKNPYVDLKKEGNVVQAPAAGTNILCLGNNLGYGIQAQNGIVSKDSLVKNIYGNVIAVVPVCAPLNSGNSGAAVYDMNGALIGMNTWQVLANSANNDVHDMCYLTPAPIIDAVFESVVKRGGDGTAAALPFTVMTEGNGGTLRIQDVRTTLFFEDYLLKVKSVEALGTRELADGDVIKKFGSITVTPCNFPSVLGELYRYHGSGTGEALTLVVERNGAERTVSLQELKRI